MFSFVPNLQHGHVEWAILRKRTGDEYNWHGVKQWRTGITMAMDCRKLDKDLNDLNNKHILRYMI